MPPLPGLGDIRRFKETVPRDGIRLDRTQVGSAHKGLEILIGHVKRPDPGAGINIEDAVDILRELGDVAVAAEKHGNEMAHQIETLLFALVVGVVIAAGIDGVITEAILVT